MIKNEPLPSFGKIKIAQKSRDYGTSVRFVCLLLITARYLIHHNHQPNSKKTSLTKQQKMIGKTFWYQKRVKNKFEKEFHDNVAIINF